MFQIFVYKNKFIQGLSIKNTYPIFHRKSKTSDTVPKIFSLLFANLTITHTFVYHHNRVLNYWHSPPFAIVKILLDK